MNSLTQHDQNLIDQHLQGDLSSAELETFNSRMSDPQFRTKVEELRAVQRAVTSEGRAKLRTEFRKWDLAKRQPRIVSLKAVAAVAAVLLVVVTFFFILPKDAGQESLASAFIEPYPNVVSPLQKGDAESSDYERAFQLYESRRYVKAEELFATLDQADESVQFYRAINFLLAGNNLQAMADFQVVTADPTHAYYKPALWYLALSQINLDMLHEARITLRNVVLGGPPYADQGIELMNSL